MRLFRLLPYVLLSLFLHFLAFEALKYAQLAKEKSLTHTYAPILLKINPYSSKNIINTVIKKKLEPAVSTHNKINNNTLKPEVKHYFSYTEVDEPASPVGEWVINTAIWPSDIVSVIYITLWISESGNIDKWEASSDTSPDLAAIALRDIDRTVINAAIRHGSKVASVRTLELTIDRTFSN